jgi:hypothetical protein
VADLRVGADIVRDYKNCAAFDCPGCADFQRNSPQIPLASAETGCEKLSASTSGLIAIGETGLS